MSSSITEYEVFELIKASAQRSSCQLPDSFNSSSDLVRSGVDSIVILGIVAELEKKCGKTIDMKVLEKCSFIISAQTLSSALK